MNPPPTPPLPPPPQAPPPTQAQAPLPQELIHTIAAERGFTPEFVEWANRSNLLGNCNGRIACPVYDHDGKFTGWQHRLSDRTWRYDPEGMKTAPVVFGDRNAPFVWVFESLWDALAAMFIMNYHTGFPPNLLIIVTRGASNGGLIAGLVRVDARAYAFVQNDQASKKGRIPSEDWINGVALHSGGIVHRVITPPQFEDFNAWTIGGATQEQVTAAITSAQVVPKPTPPPVTQGPAARIRSCHVEEPEPAEFPVHRFPEMFSRYVTDVASCQRVPPSMVAVCVLSVVSACLGKSLRAKLLPGKITPGNLFLLLAARPGTGKTDVLRMVAEPFYELERELLAAWKANVRPGLLAERDELQARRKRLKQQEKKLATPHLAQAGDHPESELIQVVRRLDEIERELNEPSLTAENVTAEKLALMLALNDEALFSVSSEAGEVLDNLSGKHNRDRPDESPYLKFYSLERLRCDRITRESVLLTEPCLAVLWMTQPDKMDKLLQNDRFVNGGLLARLMIVYEEAEIQRIEGPCQTVSDAVVQPYSSLVRKLIGQFRKGDLKVVEGDSGAVQALTAFYNEIAERRKKELADVECFAPRFAEWACRITVVLHAMVHGAAAGDHPVTLQTAEGAIEITRWFIDRHLAAANEMRRKEEEALRERVLDHLESCVEPQSLRSIYRKLRRPAGFVGDLVRRMVDDEELYEYELDNEQTGYHPQVPE